VLLIRGRLASASPDHIGHHVAIRTGGADIASRVVKRPFCGIAEHAGSVPHDDVVRVVGQLGQRPAIAAIVGRPDAQADIERRGREIVLERLEGHARVVAAVEALGHGVDERPFPVAADMQSRSAGPFFVAGLSSRIGYTVHSARRHHPTGMGDRA